MPRKLAEDNNISAMNIHKGSNTVIINTGDMIFNQLNRDCPEIEKSFDAIASDHLHEVSRLFGEIAGLIVPHIYRKDLTDTAAHPTCARLLFDALTTFTACVDLARRGFRRQFASLSRDMLETLAVIPHILIQKDALDDFNSGKLKSTKAIYSAKLVLPPYGEIYGYLSNNFVHVGLNHSSFGPVDIYSDGGEDIKFIIKFVKLEIWIAYVFSELTFLAQLRRPRYWKQIDESSFVFDPSDEVKAWTESFLETDAAFFGGTPSEAHIQPE